MIKKIAMMCAVMVLCAALCGCQLAVAGKGSSENPDMLCGMFITFSSMVTDTGTEDIDVEALLNEGIITLGGGDKQPVYATPQIMEDGKIEYIFEEIEGIPFFDTYYRAEGEDRGYWVPGYDHTVIEVVTTCEGSDSVKLEGTLYLYLNSELYDEDGNCILYCNPVYQKSTGEVYMLPADMGNLIGTKNAEDEISASLGVTLSGTSAIKSGEEERKWISNISLNVVSIGNVQSYVLKEMNAQDELIASFKITKENLPDAVTLRDDTAYALLEGHSVGADGEVCIERSVVDMSMDQFSVRFPAEMGFAKIFYIAINNKPD